MPPRHYAPMLALYRGSTVYNYINIALRRFLHNHGNIATEGSPRPGLCPTLISNDFQGLFIKQVNNV